MRVCNALVMAAVILAASGCSSPFFPLPESGVHPGIIERIVDDGGISVIEVPDTARVGQEVSITVWTWEFLGTPSAMSETRVTIDGVYVLVEPLDDYRPSAAGARFGNVARAFEHEVKVTFSRAGVATVEIRGVSVTETGDSALLKPSSLTFSIEVIQ